MVLVPVPRSVAQPTPAILQRGTAGGLAVVADACGRKLSVS